MINLNQPKVNIVALTGSIAGGKSSAAQFFKELGAFIVDADVLSRKVVSKGSPAYLEIKNAFGDSIIQADGEIDRGLLAGLIFSDQKLRKKLEEITHPRIKELFSRTLQNLFKELPDSSLVIYVVPLYFETQNKYPEIKKIIVVSSDPEISISRLIQRDKCTREMAEKKYSSQMPIAEKEKRADYVIKNNGSMQELKDKCEAVYKQLINDLSLTGS